MTSSLSNVLLESGIYHFQPFLSNEILCQWGQSFRCSESFALVFRASFLETVAIELFYGLEALLESLLPPVRKPIPLVSSLKVILILSITQL